MLVPINTVKRNDLCLSIIKTQNDYSVKIVSVKGVDLNALPSYCCNYIKNGLIVIWMEDYPAIQNKDLYKCIEECMKQIEDLLI